MSAVFTGEIRTLDVEVYVEVASWSSRRVNAVPASMQSTMIHHPRAKARRYWSAVTGAPSLSIGLPGSFGGQP